MAGKLISFLIDTGVTYSAMPVYSGKTKVSQVSVMGVDSLISTSNYRRMGIAKELLHRVVEEARNYGCGSVQITASNMGVKLYTAYGFKHNGNFMQYNL